MWTPLPASTSPGGGTTDTCPGSPLIAARSAAGLLPGVTSDQDHVRGVVTGVTDLSLRLGAPYSHQLPLRLDPAAGERVSRTRLGKPIQTLPSLVWVLRALRFFDIRCSLDVMDLLK